MSHRELQADLKGVVATVGARNNYDPDEFIIEFIDIESGKPMIVDQHTARLTYKPTKVRKSYQIVNALGMDQIIDDLENNRF